PAVIDCPTSACSSAPSGTSRITRNGLSPRLPNTPRRGLVSLASATSANPNWAEAYPSLAGVRTPTTTHGPAATTVTGTLFPASSNTWVIPSFFPSNAAMTVRSPGLELDLDVDAGRKVEMHQRVDGLRRRLHDVDEPLVGPELEVLHGFLVDVRRADHAVDVPVDRQGDGTRDARAGPLD